MDVLLTKPCPYMKCWWTKELSDLKKTKYKLSKISYHFRGTPDHPSHTEHKNAAHNIRNCIDTTKKKHWDEWLNDAKFKDIYTANRYINGSPTDYSNAHIPDLKTHNNATHNTSLTTDNATKAKVLAETFFPQPPPTPSILISAYPKALQARGTFTRSNIQDTIKSLKLNKVPGLDRIKNIVLRECVESLIDNLYYIYRAILKLNTYPTQWLTSLTIVLLKWNIVRCYSNLKPNIPTRNCIRSLCSQDLCK